MASFTTVRTAIKTTISSAVSGLRVHDTVDDMINVPAAVLIPTSINFTESMARGLDRYEFDLIVVTSRSDSRCGQNQLDGYVTGAGSSSFRQAIFNTSNLGQSDCSAVVTTMSDYGATYTVNGVECIGARLGITVYTKGTA